MTWPSASRKRLVVMRSGRKYVRWLCLWNASILFSLGMFCFILKAFIFVYAGPGKGPLCRHHPGADRWVWRGALWWHVLSWSRTSAMWALPAGGSGRAGGVVFTFSITAGKTGPGAGERRLYPQTAGAVQSVRGLGEPRRPASPLRRHQRHFPPQPHSALRSHVLRRMHHGCDRMSGVRSFATPNHGGIESSSPPRHGLKRSFPFQTRSCGRRFTRRTECSIFRTWCCPPPLSLKKTCSPPCTPSSSSTKWRLLACCRWVFVLNHV